MDDGKKKGRRKKKKEDREKNIKASKGPPKLSFFLPYAIGYVCEYRIILVYRIVIL